MSARQHLGCSFGNSLWIESGERRNNRVGDAWAETLVVEDASGSMREPAGTSTRAEMLMEAGQNGLKTFPNSSAPGVWLFSIADRSHRTPRRRRCRWPDPSRTPGVADRDTSGSGGRRTGLYDTTLAAELKRVEDPARPVLILTIGITEDADSESLKQIADATGGSSYVAETPADISNGLTESDQLSRPLLIIALRALWLRRRW